MSEGTDALVADMIALIKRKISSGYPVTIDYANAHRICNWLSSLAEARAQVPRELTPVMHAAMRRVRESEGGYADMWRAAYDAALARPEPEQKEKQK